MICFFSNVPHNPKHISLETYIFHTTPQCVCVCVYYSEWFKFFEVYSSFQSFLISHSVHLDGSD